MQTTSEDKGIPLLEAHAGVVLTAYDAHSVARNGRPNRRSGGGRPRLHHFTASSMDLRIEA